ncbi:MAG: tyrosine-protein phosphatase [Eubacteriaceae bacterium]|nr:tyrosine-protein phosphatase [Eubacteriaceae bacterium]
MARTVRSSLPMKLDGARNCRDLGGYPTKYGINTATGQFLRSDNPSKFTEDDLQRLYDYGVRLQIDFRSDKEASGEAASKLDGYRNVEYILSPLIGDVTSDADLNALPPTLGDMYIDFLDNKKGAYLRALRNVLRYMDDCVFFNCTAGKDRTGTFAMILLKLAGVSDEDVVIDYQSTGDNIKVDMDKALEDYKARGITLDEDMLRSRPVHMEKVLAHLKNTYGTIEHWMTLCGLAEWEIVALRNKMLGQF